LHVRKEAAVKNKQECLCFWRARNTDVAQQQNSNVVRVETHKNKKKKKYLKCGLYLIPKAFGGNECDLAYEALVGLEVIG
jgi:hypothetical protein